MAAFTQPQFLLIGFENCSAWQPLLSALESAGLPIARSRSLAHLKVLLQDRPRVVLLVGNTANSDTVSTLADLLAELHRACPCILLAECAHYGLYREFDTLDVCFVFDSSENPEMIVLAARWLAETKAC